MPLKKQKYIFGPVPSRRLGISLGVDIVPFKTCSLDCIYCQIGKSPEKTIERKQYTPIDDVLGELKEKLVAGTKADFITISGSGEPTLHSRLGELIDGIKILTGIPVAVITNGTLFYMPDVRADCAKADVVVPSLDAGDEEVFQRINRPHPQLSMEKLIDGLCQFRKQYSGRMWLEVFFIEGVNNTAGTIAKIKSAIELIGPDKVQLNTAVRPTAERGVKKLQAEQLQAIALQLGGNAEVIADFSDSRCSGHADGKSGDILLLLKRRPCSLSDICSGLDIGRDEALKYVADLVRQGVVGSEERDGTVFFTANVT